VWFQYEDNKGTHLACADHVLPDEKMMVECKRTYTPEADAQLSLVYGPLANFLWPGDWKLVVACKFWEGEEKPLIGTFGEAKPGLNYLLRRF